MEAERIKREIEGRGWDWSIYSSKYCERRFRCNIIIPESIDLIGQASADSEEEALRLALQDVTEDIGNA